MKGMRRWLLLAVLAVALVAGGVWQWRRVQAQRESALLAGGNGRIEATEIGIATKLAGRVASIAVREGDAVRAGQVLAVMDLDSLAAQRDEARAALLRAGHQAAAVAAQVALRESDAAAAQAVIAQREAELDAAQRRERRSARLVKDGAASQQELDDDRARVRGAQAALAAARAQAQAARAAISAERAQQVGAQAAEEAARATLARIEVELRDGELRAPRDGRVQVRLAEPGEVLAAGARVLTVLDLSDVHMTFFLPAHAAGRVALGAPARIVLDAAPHEALPARVSFVASEAQFTPKTVETASEREKLMFRVKAQLSPELLRARQGQMKTGVPGTAWVRLDEAQPWPEHLQLAPPLQRFEQAAGQAFDAAPAASSAASAASGASAP